MIRKIVCIVVQSLALMFAVPAVAQNIPPLQGNWIGNGCFGKGAPFAVSYSIHGNSTTLNGLITNTHNIPMNSTAPASYRKAGNQTEISSETTSKNFKFIIRTTSESGTLSGIMNGMKIILNRGPISDLPKYYNAYAHACD
jgi:hypothetical protein